MIIYFFKFLVWFLRTFTGNSGTALPGLWLEKYFPKTAKKLLSGFDTVILVTGTNGKTTTTKMICHLLQKNGISFVTNQSGSNLVRGILSSVLVEANFLRSKKFAVFEVEEGSMPKLTSMVEADYIVVTNIFRDQLDAYGEIDKTLKYIRTAIESSNNPKLILNYDDERVRSLASSTTSSVQFVSFEEKYRGLIKSENTGAPQELTPGKVFLIKNIEVDDDLKSSFDVYEGETLLLHNYKVSVPGIHNTLNSLMAVILFLDLTEKNLIKDSSGNIFLNDFEPAFGRGEIITIQPFSAKASLYVEALEDKSEGRQLDNPSIQQFQILLAKNPAGLNLNFHLLKNVKKRDAILLILNDKIADGRDISWIWDADFSILKNLGFANIFIAGTRRYDLALRLGYEFGIKSYDLEKIKIKKLKVKSVDAAENTSEVFIYEDLENGVKDFIELGFDKVYVLPTYTAMREFRDELAKYTEVKKMYE